MFGRSPHPVLALTGHGVQADDWPGAAWEQLRATRWKPPGAAAGDDRRRRTYLAALGQAEQMFRAAATVGPATRPLHLFYGLSQAGRAIAAAATKIQADDGWQLNGHDIKTMPKTMGGPLADIQVRSDRAGGAGSFVRLSELLGSPLLPESRPATLSALWDLLPENGRSPLSNNDKARRTPLRIDHRDLFEEPHPLASVPVIGFPPWVVTSPHGRQNLDTDLEAFPEAQDYHSYRRTGDGPDATPIFDHHNDGWGELLMHWKMPEGRPGSPVERASLLEARTRPYCGTWYFFPALSTTSCSMHPLMAWWAVLHTLSMLARYQPAEWAGHIDVNSSRNAVPLERFLKLAIDVVPKVITEAIEQAALPAH